MHKVFGIVQPFVRTMPIGPDCGADVRSLPDHLLKGFGVLVPDDLEKGLSNGLSTIVKTIKFACRQQDGFMWSCSAATKPGSGALLLGRPFRGIAREIRNF